MQKQGYLNGRTPIFLFIQSILFTSKIHIWIVTSGSLRSCFENGAFGIIVSCSSPKRPIPNSQSPNPLIPQSSNSPIKSKCVTIGQNGPKLIEKGQMCPIGKSGSKYFKMGQNREI